MSLSRKLALAPEQIDEIMDSQWNCRIATAGPGARINLTPMWFGWDGRGDGTGVVYIIRIDPDRILSWDNFKLAELR